MRLLSRLAELTRYAVATAGVNFWRHRAMSVAAVFAAAVMMLMLNGFVIVVSNLNVALAALEQKVNLIAYVKDDAPQADIDRFVDRMRADPTVLEVLYVSKDASMARLKTQLADRTELLDMVTGNPLPASVEIRLRDPAKIGQLAAALRAEAPFEEVALQQD